MRNSAALSMLFVPIVCTSVALSSFAQTRETYSLNALGFQKLSLQSNGLTMVSTPFTDSPNTLDDVIGTQLTAGKTDGGADNVTLWNSSNQSYETYWLNIQDGKWYTLSYDRATNTSIHPNMGLFVRNRAATKKTVVVSGDVTSDFVITNKLLPGLNMVSYPFSKEIDLNRSALTNGHSDKTDGGADNVIIWNSTAKQYATYWLSSGDRQWHTLNPGDVATNVKVGGGQGFWYRNRASTFNWVEVKPYTL